MSGACSTSAGTSNTFPYTGPVMLSPMSLLKLFSLLLALAPHVCDTAVPGDVDGVKMVSLQFLRYFCLVRSRMKSMAITVLFWRLKSVCRAGSGAGCRGLPLVHDILMAIRPVLQNFCAQRGNADLAPQVDKEVAEASRACSLAQ